MTSALAPRGDEDKRQGGARAAPRAREPGAGSLGEKTQHDGGVAVTPVTLSCPQLPAHPPDGVLYNQIGEADPKPVTKRRCVKAQQ